MEESKKKQAKSEDINLDKIGAELAKSVSENDMLKFDNLIRGDIKMRLEKKKKRA